MLLFLFAVSNTQIGRVLPANIIFHTSYLFKSVLSSGPICQYMRVQKDKIDRTLNRIGRRFVGLSSDDHPLSLYEHHKSFIYLFFILFFCRRHRIRIHRGWANKNHSKFESNRPPQSYTPARGPTEVRDKQSVCRTGSTYKQTIDAIVLGVKIRRTPTTNIRLTAFLRIE